MNTKGVTTRRGAANSETAKGETANLKTTQPPSRKRKTCESSTKSVGSANREASESEDSVLGTRTRCQARKKNAQPPQTPFVTELRLYYKEGQTTPSTPSPTLSRRSLMLTEDVTSCKDCFNSICKEAEAECNFIVFQFPEDMAMQGSVRIVRGSEASEATFQQVRRILQRARKFPGGPPHRSVEVEIG